MHRRMAGLSNEQVHGASEMLIVDQVFLDLVKKPSSVGGPSSGQNNTQTVAKPRRMATSVVDLC